MKVYGEYENFMSEPAGATWSAYYTDSQIMEGKAKGPLPVPPSSVYGYADIPSLNAVAYHPTRRSTWASLTSTARTSG